VLNLVKLAGAALPCLFEKVVRKLTAYLVGLVENLIFNSTRIACMKMQPRTLPNITTDFFEFNSSP
jgi:hypothetical protein